MSDRISAARLEMDKAHARLGRRGAELVQIMISLTKARRHKEEIDKVSDKDEGEKILPPSGRIFNSNFPAWRSEVEGRHFPNPPKTVTGRCGKFEVHPHLLYPQPMHLRQFSSE